MTLIKLPAHKAGLFISHNEHRNYYESIADYLGDLVRLARGPVRVRARCEIAGRDFSFPKGKRLFGERDSYDGTWTVWPASDPQAFLCAVSPECVRIVKPNTPVRDAAQPRSL